MLLRRGAMRRQASVILLMSVLLLAGTVLGVGATTTITFNEPRLVAGFGPDPYYSGTPKGTPVSTQFQGVGVLFSIDANGVNYVSSPSFVGGLSGPSGGNVLGVNTVTASPTSLTATFVDPSDSGTHGVVDAWTFSLFVSDTEHGVTVRTFGIDGGLLEEKPLASLGGVLTFSIGQIARVEIHDQGGDGFTIDDFTFGSVRPVTFLDVLPTHFAYTFIEQLYAAGITGGCMVGPPPSYCPEDTITRGQMAVLIEASLKNPANTCMGRFTDVPVGNPFCGFIERMADDGITGGCGDGIFCLNEPVTRAQMAVFIEAALGGPPPAPCTGTMFTDVTPELVGQGFCDFIEKLAGDGISGGCTATTFCPNDPVTRAQMAVFIVAGPPPLNP